MTKLISKPINRFFAFGCSFTKYKWCTWPEIIADDLSVDYYNFGQEGSGNELIFNRIVQVDKQYNLTENDLVMVCWTSVNREDRFVNGKWLTAGNIYRQSLYPKSFVKDYYSNPEDALLHDFAYIRASRILLEHKSVQYHFLQMIDILDKLNEHSSMEYKKKSKLFDLYDEESTFFKPGMFNFLCNSNVAPKKSIEDDLHPSPKECLQYLDHVFDHSWKSSTVQKINELETEYDYNRHHNGKHFSHLRQSLKCDKIH